MALQELSQKLLWHILLYLPTEDIVFSLCYVSKGINKALNLFPLAIDKIRGEDRQYLDIGWFDANASIFVKRWSVRSFACQLEQNDSVLKVYQDFFRLYSNTSRLEDVKEIFIDDLRAQKIKRNKKAITFESHFSGLCMFPSLEKLSFVNVPFFAADLTSEQVTKTLQNLKYVKFWSCEVDGLFELFNYMNSVETLILVYVDIKDLSFLRTCEQVNYLEVSSCGNLASLEGIQLLQNLKQVKINWCTKLVDISQLSLCPKLDDVSIDHCDWISSLTTLALPSITTLSLEALAVENGDFLAYLPGLTKLSINFCPFNKNPLELDLDTEQPFRALREVRLSWFGRTLFQGFDKVVFCQLYECSAFETLEDLRQMASLEDLELKRCDNLKTLEGIEFCPKLRSLFIAACFKLDDIYSLNECEKLERLIFRRLVVPQLSNFPLESNYSIKTVGYIFCSDMLTIDCISNFEVLESLEMDNCTALMDFSPIGNHPTLKNLSMRGMSQPGLKPVWPILCTNLRKLTIRVCATVEAVVPGTDEESTLEEFELGQCYAFDNFDFLLDSDHLSKVTLVRCYDKMNAELEDKLASKGVFVKRVGVSNKIRLQVQRELARLQSISPEEVNEIDNHMSV